MKAHSVLITACYFALIGSVYAGEFHGYPCTQDCSGHIAGYEWAEKKNIAQHENCGGWSNSFIEGCHAWVEEQNGAEPYSSEPHNNNDDGAPEK